MTFLWINDQGLPPRHFRQQRFERRIDDRTAGDIADALRARGIGAAALAMDHLQVDMDVALRVLAGTHRRHNAVQEAVRAVCRVRKPPGAAAAAFSPQLAEA